MVSYRNAQSFQVFLYRQRTIGNHLLPRSVHPHIFNLAFRILLFYSVVKIELNLKE